MRRVSDRQVERLMQALSKTNKIGLAAMIAGMDEKTARKYIRAQKLPSQFITSRTWKTRDDPFLQDWDAITQMMDEHPEFTAKTVFEVLSMQHPERYSVGQLRTLQRKIRHWRAERGPEQPIMFGQAHRPGEAAQTDFTHATELGVTILGNPYPHMLCVFVLPYSNWEWATVCTSESLLAIRRGVQDALFQLGYVPTYHQTDNSTAATHRIPTEKLAFDGESKRKFNDDYIALMAHFGMKPRTTKIGAKQQNGDVEAANGALKRRLKQRLLLRASADFSSVDEWQRFIHDVLRSVNATRGKRFAEEIAAMRPLSVARLSDFTEEHVTVSRYSTVRVKHASYSVPSRLRGHRIRVRIYERHLEFYLGNTLQLSCERQTGTKRHCINYQHVIWSLVRKPGAFARYVYREEMYPSQVFRRAYDAIHSPHQGTRGDLEYLRILHLAASTSQNDVQAGLELLFDQGVEISFDAVKSVVCDSTTCTIPQIEKPTIDLSQYDALLKAVGE